MRYILCIGLLVFLTSLEAQNTNLQFRHLTMEDGLADGWVHDMIMDSKGLIWFATHDGISRYDGHHFKNYKYDPNDSTSIAGPVTMCIREGENGVYWIAANGVGLVRFDSKKEEFHSYRSEAKDTTSISHLAATTIHIDDDKELWIGTFDGGLNHFHKETGTFSRYSLPDTAIASTQSFMLNSVRHIVDDPLNPTKLWLVSHQGIYHFDKKTGKKKHYPLLRWGNPAFGVSLLADSSGLLWIGTENHGLVQFDSRSLEVAFLSDAMQAKNIYRKSAKELWVSTIGKGLGIYNLETKTWQFCTAEDSRKHGILSNDVYGLYVDKERRLWVRDMHRGVSVSSARGSLFHNPIAPVHVPPNLWGIKKFSFDSTRNVLFAATQDNNYVFSFEKKEGTYSFKRTAQFIDYQDIENLKLLNIYTTSKGKTFALMRHGEAVLLFEYGHAFGTFSLVDIPFFKKLNGTNIEYCSMREDTAGWLWFALPGGQLFAMKNGTYQTRQIGTTFESSPQIWDIIFDKNNDLWACSLTDGVIRFDVESSKETHFSYALEDGLHAWRITAITELHNGKLWVGASAAGIQELDPTKSVYQHMPTHNQTSGFPDDKIAYLSTDTRGNVWTATNRGLVRYSPKTKQFKQFGEGEGLKNTFLTYGVTQVNNGDILLGMPLGFQHLNPEESLENTDTRPPFFTKLYVNGAPHKTDSILEYADKIILQPEENYFTVFFSARYYDHQDQVTYKYILEGFDRDWTTTKAGLAQAKFTNVAPGDYTLKVVAANSDGYWNDSPAELKIRIRAHWYASAFAKLLYILASIGIITAFVLAQRRRELLQKELELEKVELDNIRNMEQLKSEMLAQSERLLLNILPADIAQELKEKGSVKPRQLKQSTILFLDFKGFTMICNQLTASELIHILSTIFGEIDSIIAQHGLERIKTIGDAYMAFGGMSEKSNKQAIAMVHAALDMQAFLEKWNIENPQFPSFEARIGIHAGAITAGVVGHQKFAFDIWGEAVNMASRMESYGTPKRINISAEFYALISEYFECKKREAVDVKGYGNLDMYYVLRARDGAGV